MAFKFRKLVPDKMLCWSLRCFANDKSRDKWFSKAELDKFDVVFLLLFNKWKRPRLLNRNPQVNWLALLFASLSLPINKYTSSWIPTSPPKCQIYSLLGNWSFSTSKSWTIDMRAWLSATKSNATDVPILVVFGGESSLAHWLYCWFEPMFKKLIPIEGVTLQKEAALCCWFPPNDLFKIIPKSNK